MFHRCFIEEIPIELDFERDPIFLNADNFIYEEGVKKYEKKIDNNEEIDYVEVIKVRNIKNLLGILNISGIVPLGIEVKIDDWIYIVTCGHHRTKARFNKIKKLKARIIGSI